MSIKSKKKNKNKKLTVHRALKCLVLFGYALNFSLVLYHATHMLLLDAKEKIIDDFGEAEKKPH